MRSLKRARAFYRRFSGFSDSDVVTVEANLIGGDGIVGDAALLGLACPDIKRSEMPWAGDDVSVELTVRKGTTLRRLCPRL